MTHLYIELNNIPEVVTSNVIHKLYETAKAIIDAEEANEVQESLVSLKGNLLVPVSYRAEVTWLLTKFPDLYITSADYAIPFEDPNMLSYLLSLGIGSNGMITESLAAAATVVANSLNTTVTKFNELKYFTNVTSSRGGISSSSSGYIRFIGWTALEEVDISNFTSIGHNNAYAYEDTLAGCTSLTTIKTNGRLTDIGYIGFSGCTNLTTITGLSGNINLYHGVLFKNCSSLTSSNFANCTFDPSYSTSYGQCFLNCTSLTTVPISTNTTTIPKECFSGCTALTSIDLSNVTSIGQSSFLNCTSLTNIDLSSCTTIGSNAFNGCTLLTSVILGNNITNIPEYAFGKSGLTSVSSNYVTTIGRLAFWGCPNLHSVDFPNVTSINDEWELVDPTYINMPLSNKLPGLSGTGGTLTDVVIPQSVTVLKNNWAWYYNNLQSVKFQTAIPPTLGTKIVKDSVTIYVPSANLSDYLTAYPGYSSLMIGY